MPRAKCRREFGFPIGHSPPGNRHFSATCAVRRHGNVWIDWPMSNPILSARGLAKTYLSGDRKIGVLRGVDLDVSSGESVSIRGESGSGKSTLLNLLAGLDSAD